VNKSEKEQQLKLQRKLESLTQSPDWITDPVIRLVVHQLHSELYTHVFKDTEEQIQKKKQRYQIG
jgi:hypothetical protein